MTATVSIIEGNGSSVAWTPVTNGRFCTADVVAPGNNYPCVVPTSGFDYSFWKHFALNFSGNFTQLSNGRFYTSGAIKADWKLGSGGMLLVGVRDSGDNGCPVANYHQATGVVGTSGNYLKDATNGHEYYKSQTVGVADADSYTSANPLVFDTTVYTAGGMSKAVVLQVKLAYDGVQGDKPAQVLTFKYDEV
jgi:hypothetical protein